MLDSSKFSLEVRWVAKIKVQSKKTTLRKVNYPKGKIGAKCQHLNVKIACLACTAKIF